MFNENKSLDLDYIHILLFVIIYNSVRWCVFKFCVINKYMSVFTANVNATMCVWYVNVFFYRSSQSLINSFRV